MRQPILVCALWMAIVAAPFARSHPLPVKRYDRTITVSLSPKGIEITYALTIDPQTVLLDLPEFLNKKKRDKLSSNNQRIDAFGRELAPLLAKQIEVTLNDKPLSLRCHRRDHELIDHLTYELCYRATWMLADGEPNSIRIRDTSYLEANGRVRLAVLPSEDLKVLMLIQPDKELNTKALIDFKPGDEARARFAMVTVRVLTPTEFGQRKKQRPQAQLRFPFRQ